MSVTIDQAEALLAAGRAADGIALLEPEARRHPESFELWHCLGRAYGLAGRQAEAEGAFRVAVRLRPDLHDAHYNLALSLAYQDKLSESVGHFVSARRISPRNPDLHKTLFPILVTLLQRSAGPGASGTGKIPPLAERPLVSVIVPTLNRPQMLRDALESVGRQTHEHWEAIVVNDGGGDVTPVLDALPRAVGTRILPIRLPASRGPAAARNAGIKVAKGDVVAFLDDDDLHAPTHLERLVTGLRASGAGLAYTAAELVEETVRAGVRAAVRRRPFLPGLSYSRPLLMVRNYIPINTWGVRRECFETAGVFDETLHYLEDWDFLLRLSARVDFHRMTEITAEYRVTEGAGDSLTKRHSHQPAVKSLYQRHDPRGLEWVALARELYLESLA
jgi:hypothetical protein